MWEEVSPEKFWRQNREGKYLLPKIGKKSLYKSCNSNSLSVFHFATLKNFNVMNNCLPRKVIHRVSPDGSIKSQIHHYFFYKRRHTSIKKVWSYRGADCDSDHHVLVIVLLQRLFRLDTAYKAKSSTIFTIYRVLMFETSTL